MFPPIPFSFSLNPIATILRSLFFYAPRTSTITQTRGAGTPTITRATVATVTNNDGYLVTALSGELREEGARRIRNLIAGSSQAMNGDSWTTDANATATNNTTDVLDPLGGNTATKIVATAASAGVFNSAAGGTGFVGADSWYLRGAVGGEQVKIGDGATTTTVTLTADWVRYHRPVIASIASAFPLVRSLNAGTTTWYAWGAQREDVTAQTTQTAGEYVSVGVLSAPYHGAGVDGVKYFSTDISGAPIPAAALTGAVVEAAATQYLGVTGTPATQTTASLGTGTYTLWVEGTGSALASAGTATISGEAAATEGSHNTFTVSGAGTVTVTVTGSLTFFQLENSPYPTQRIDNAGAVGTSATRNKDVLDDQVASNLTAAAGSVAFTWTPSHDPSGTIALCGSYVDASNYTALLHDATKYIWRKRIAGVNYDAELTAAYANGTSAKIALTLGASGINLAVDGTLGTAHANTDDAQLGTRWQWGADGNGGQQAGAAFKEMYLTPRTLSDAELQAITV